MLYASLQLMHEGLGDPSARDTAVSDVRSNCSISKNIMRSSGDVDICEMIPTGRTGATGKDSVRLNQVPQGVSDRSQVSRTSQ